MRARAKKRKVGEYELTTDDRKKAVYSSYLDYTLVTTSSVYDYYARLPHGNDKGWEELKKLQKNQKKQIPQKQK